VVRSELPAGFVGLVLAAADLHGDAIDGTIVRTPDRARDERVWLGLRFRTREES
jgi:hypothetical protein